MEMTEETNQKLIKDRLPIPYSNVIITCEDYSCLAYIDLEGDWRYAFSQEKINQLVLGWVPITVARPDFRMSDYFCCENFPQQPASQHN